MTMDDRFLHERRREPDPGFASRLRARLGALDADEAPRRATWLRPALAAALATAAACALFAFPAVRAAAQQMLDLFRVREFAVIQIDEARLQAFRDRKLDPETLLGGKVEKLQEPGPPRAFASIEAATAAAGFAPLRPTVLPRGVQLDTVWVTNESRARVTVDTKPLRALMEAFEIRDLDLPPGLDGRQVEIHVPRVVVERFRNDRKARVALVQGGSPEVSLPPGADLARLGEIGLRLMGLEAGEAARLSRSIDWRTTLLVPVIASATTFQQVTINGARGVCLETSVTHGPDGTDTGPGAAVLWSRDDRVYAVVGNLDRVATMSLAESVR